MKQQSTAINSDPADRLATIWAIVEARNTLPALIVVTSATHADDTSSIARGLAAAGNSAGQNVGYLELTAGSRSTGASGPYASLSIDPRGSPREAFDGALERWRTMYDVIIVDAATLGSAALAAHVARISDGVVIAVCDKRRVVPADRELAVLLSELQACVIGVVLSAPLTKSAPTRVSRDHALLERAAQL
jgi:Mrp family chromosome partitioning ATPase